MNKLIINGIVQSYNHLNKFITYWKREAALFFEGAEKKLEIIVDKSLQPLTARPDGFWKEIVAKCEATILSQVENDKMKAFLLSESSLFVWDDRILMLTCGQTKLIQSAKYFVEELGANHVDCLFFQRKNEYRAQLQPSDFLEDVKNLMEDFDGETVRFGKLHSHHTQLFHTTKSYRPLDSDCTCELLMYDMEKPVIDFLTREDLDVVQVRDFFQLEKIFPDFQLDDFVFKPYGYSLNGIRGEDYLTIHVTPQEKSPYVSFETNISISSETRELLNHFLEILRPFSFDVMTFNCTTELDFGNTYIKSIHVKDSLSIGYEVDFRYFNKKSKVPEKAYRYTELD